MKIVVSKYHSHRKEPGLTTEMAYSRTGAGNVSDDLGISCPTKKLSQITTAA